MIAHHRLSNFRFSSSATCNPTATRTVDQLREHGSLPRSERVRRLGLEPRTRGFVSVVPVVLGGLPPGSVPAVLGDSPRILAAWACLSFDLSLVPPAPAWPTALA